MKMYKQIYFYFLQLEYILKCFNFVMIIFVSIILLIGINNKEDEILLKVDMLL